MTAAEAVPFAKTGGLADVAGILPKFVQRRGHDVRVVMPRYWSIERAGLKRLESPLGVPMGVIGTLWAAVFEGRLPGSDVPVYFIDFEHFFGRKSIYNEPSTGEGYADNDNRFVFLSRAALQLARMLDFQPDVVHCNDWHTAVIPVFLNTLYANDPGLSQAASLLTIHNMQHQGNFYPGLMDVLGIGWRRFNHLELEFHGRLSLLKGGIYHATLINAVSRRYAAEIQRPEFGHGLDGVVWDRRGDLSGITNGIDYEEWNPETDPHIAANYSARDLSGKARCKAALQREMGLPERPNVPLLGMVSRLVHQKGVDVLLAALDAILAMDVQVVVLGSGDPRAQQQLRMRAAVRPAQFACHIGYDNPLAHRIEAGSDFYLMPSRFEPCGQNQLFSLRYGTLPIVHAVGGLDDTVVNFDEHTLEGTGFKFLALTPTALANTVGWAVHVYYDRPDAMRLLIERAMAQRFSWEEAAEKYEALYREAVRRRRGIEAVPVALEMSS